ncbi:MAG TPA: hypothetical protein VKQ71_00815 [Acidimicrobiales bacterium]|nr:hypothetical protein [Acidimicrobiales bacterium]
MTDWNTDSTDEWAASADAACSQPCPWGDGTCALGLPHFARHCCGTDTSHRWETEIPA